MPAVRPAPPGGRAVTARAASPRSCLGRIPAGMPPVSCLHPCACAARRRISKSPGIALPSARVHRHRDHHLGDDGRPGQRSTQDAMATWSGPPRGQQERRHHGRQLAPGLSCRSSTHPVPAGDRDAGAGWAGTFVRAPLRPVLPRRHRRCANLRPCSWACARLLGQALNMPLTPVSGAALGVGPTETPRTGVGLELLTRCRSLSQSPRLHRRQTSNELGGVG